MANVFTDDIPAIADEISTDYNLIRSNLGFLKDSFQAICNNWGDDGAELKTSYIYSDPVFGDVTKHYEKIEFSLSTSESVTSLNADGLYRINLWGYLSTTATITIRFNSDSGANYTYGYQFSGQLSNTGQHSSTTSEGATSIAVLPLTSTGIFVTDIIFGSSPANTDNTILNAKTSAYTSGTQYYEASVIGYYGGSSALTSVQIISSSSLIGTGAIERIA